MSTQPPFMAVLFAMDGTLVDTDGAATPGARELIDALDRDGIGWAVVSGADAPRASSRLASAGIEAPVLVTVDDVPAARPDPEVYVEAARRLDTAPFACLVVEDSPVGAAAGHAAGSTVAGLRGTPADVPIASLDELHTVLEFGPRPAE